MVDITLPFEDDDQLPIQPVVEEPTPLPGVETGPFPLEAYSGEPEPEDFSDVAEEILSVGKMGDGTDFFSNDEMRHDTNLAKLMEQGDLNSLATDIINWVDTDRASRADWERRESDGIKMLGVTDEVVNSVKSADPGASWGSVAVHPGLQKACIQFWARAFSELMPAGGPAKAVVLGYSNPDLEAQAKRVASFLNYQYTEDMPGAITEMSQLLYRLPLSGSVFKKQGFDPVTGSLFSKFIESSDFIKPYSANDLQTATRYTHVIRMTRNDVNKAVSQGIYLNVMRGAPDDESDEHQEIDKTIDSATGQKPMTEDAHREAEYDNRDILYECAVVMDLYDRGYDDPLGSEVWTDPDTGDLIPEADVDPDYHTRVGIGVPYLVTVSKDEQRTMSVRRHWREQDERKMRRRDVVEYQFLPGLGGYGFGLLHIAGGLASSQTGFLRYLLDGCSLDTLGRLSGYVSQNAVGARKLPPLKLGELQTVQGNVEDWDKEIWTPDFQWRTNNTLETLQYLDTLLDFLVASTESMIGDANKDVPVGTILARIEQSTKPFAAIFTLLHASLAREMRSLSELSHDYMPGIYPFAVEGESAEVFKTDFDDRVDVRPVSDPNVVSSTQRMILAEAVLRGARENIDVLGPEVLKQAWKNYLIVMRVANPENYMPPEVEAVSDPAMDAVEAEEERKDASALRDIQRKDAAAGAEIKRKNLLSEQMNTDSALKQQGDEAMQSVGVSNEADATAARVLRLASARGANLQQGAAGQTAMVA